MSEEPTIAAIFDFDAVIFHPDARWKINDIRLGQLGSRISFNDAFKIFIKRQESEPNLLLTDCFTLDEFEYEEADSTASNITPPLMISKTAQSHLFRGHKLIFLSFSKHRELQLITDRLVGELRFPVLKNPFNEALHLFPNNTELSLKEEQKFELIVSLLRHKDRKIVNITDEASLGYTTIHFYYTSQVLAKKLIEYTQKNQELLVGGRNALTFSFIAQVT